jgi:hypothetical protein
MGTSQRARGNADGSTLFAIATDGSRLDDYLGPIRDGCYGMKLFANSRGYTVSEAFSQCIYPNPVYTQITQGFTFADYKAEIDAGRPVMIQVQGHTMVGYGYSDTGNLVYLRDTWDYNPHTSHTMPWGGYYNNGQNMRHFAVTVFRLAAPGAVYDEDFETGDLTRCAWQTGGDAPWSVTDAEPHSPRHREPPGVVAGGHPHRNGWRGELLPPCLLAAQWRSPALPD